MYTFVIANFNRGGFIIRRLVKYIFKIKDDDDVVGLNFYFSRINFCLRV